MPTGAMHAARLSFITPAARLAIASPGFLLPCTSCRSVPFTTATSYSRAIRTYRRFQTVACEHEPSASSAATSDNGTVNNEKQVSGNGASRTLLGKVVVEVFSLVVGALLLLVVVAWRASQVVSAAAWRALVWLSNLRRLGKWAFARAAQAQKQVPVVVALRNAIVNFFIRTAPKRVEKVMGESRSSGSEEEVQNMNRDIERMMDMVSADVVEVMERRRLILVRHAKTVWERESEVSDHERVLSGRGKEEAEVVGRALTGRGWVPHKVLCSDAVRTVQTLNLLNVPEREGQKEAICTESLYYAVTGEEMAIAVDEAMGVGGFVDRTTLMVVCHNPGCEELVEQLTGHRPEMGTGCAALLEFEGKENAGEGEDVFRLSPRQQEWKLVDVLRPAVLAASYGGSLD